jgi:hypothetical protein
VNSNTLTRRSLIGRATGLAGGTAAYLAFGRLPLASGATPNGGTCSIFGDELICATGWGGASCTRSEKTQYSPDESFWGSFFCECSPGFCDCDPKYVQVRVTVCNEGGCSATCVDAS